MVILISLAKYGTGALLDPDGNVIFPEEVFWSASWSTVGAFIICIIRIFCVAETVRQQHGIAGLIGLTIPALGVAAQFIEGTAHRDASGLGRWGVIGIIVVLAWLGSHDDPAPSRRPAG